MTPLPPWKPRNVQQQKKMIDWVIEQLYLDNTPNDEMSRLQADPTAIAEFRRSFDFEIARREFESAKKRSDIEAMMHAVENKEFLREIISKLARKPGRPMRTGNMEAQQRVRLARSYIPKVRAIWRRHYKKSSRGTMKPSAKDVIEAFFKDLGFPPLPENWQDS